MRYCGNALVYHEQSRTVKVHTSNNLYIFFDESFYYIFHFFTVGPIEGHRGKVKSKSKYKRLVSIDIRLTSINVSSEEHFSERKLKLFTFKIFFFQRKTFASNVY